MSGVLVGLAAVACWIGLVWLIIAVFRGSARGPHPSPERPGIGEDPSADDDGSGDDDDEREHTAWL